jgi:hypothetical protein
MLEDWSNGVMECWSNWSNGKNGMVEEWGRIGVMD